MLSLLVGCCRVLLVFSLLLLFLSFVVVVVFCCVVCRRRRRRFLIAVVAVVEVVAVDYTAVVFVLPVVLVPFSETTNGAKIKNVTPVLQRNGEPPAGRHAYIIQLVGSMRAKTKEGPACAGRCKRAQKYTRYRSTAVAVPLYCRLPSIVPVE